MAPLKLKNNTGLLEEKNLCYVNSALQILHNIPEVKDSLQVSATKINRMRNLQFVMNFLVFLIWQKIC